MTDTIEREMLERLRGDLGTGAETEKQGFLSSHVMSLLAIAWLAVAGILALIGAWVAITPPKPLMLDVGQIDIWFNAALLTCAVAISVVVGLVSPAYWRRVMVVIAVLPVPVVLFTSHNILAGGTLLALLIPAVWLGHEVAAALLSAGDAITGWTIGGAFGFTLVACAGFSLGLAGLLRPLVIWPIILFTTLALMLRARQRLGADLDLLSAWLRRPVARDPVQFLLAGAGIAFVWINLLGALAPEVTSDAVRQRLATAARFAATAHLTTNIPNLTVANDPAAGEIAYATALAIGSLQSAKLFHFVVGLGCAAAIFALGRRLGGVRAGALAGFAFYAMPLVGSLSQSAYLDLIPTFCGVTAALAIASRKRPDWRAALAAGVCLGSGVAVKIQFGYVAVGLAVILGIICMQRGSVVATARLVALLTSAAMLTAGPFLIRSFVLTGNVPGLMIGTQSLTRTSGADQANIGILAVYGYGRSFADLLRAPFDLMVRSAAFTGDPTLRYWGPYGGHLGFLALGLLPLLAIARPRSVRLMLALVAGIATAFLLWFYTAQYLRYGLPVFALLCPIAAVAYTSTHKRIQGVSGRAISQGLLLLLATATVATGVSVPNVEWRYALGREDATTYLTRYFVCCGSYTALRLLDTERGATRALAIPEQAQVYTRVPLSSPSDSAAAIALAGTDKQVLAWLDAGRYSHIIVDRRLPTLLWSGWDQITAINEDFLRRNTVLVGGDHNAYLYRLLPPDQRGGQHPWARGNELLSNGGFETALPAGWSSTGHPRYDNSGKVSKEGKGAVLLTQQDSLVTSVNVVPNAQYLLSEATWSASGPGEARLEIAWHDGAGKVIGYTEETVPVSQHNYRTTSTLATAPAGAITATVRLQATQGNIWFDDVSLRAR